MDRVQREIDKVKDFAHTEFRSITPVRTGNARRNTRRTQAGVEAGYNYANRLNKGHSKQAPDGMTKPTVEAIQAFVRRI
tara:strand:- start:504 stop:740 length:237 start_codon:yes stop_codon:yes gene_type:complete